MKKYSILIIDDEAEFINTIVEILEATDLKLNFYHALNGITGIELAQNLLPDIILTDWDMPEMNGLEFVQKLKYNALTKKIPIIMITGIMTTPENLKQAYDIGVIDFVRKPIEHIELVARINSVLKIFEFQKLKIKQMNKELAIHASYISTNNSFFKNILSKINNLQLISSINQKAVRVEIEEINKKIENQTNSNVKFNHYFKQIHPQFEKKLIEKYPELKSDDIKLAIFIRLNLSTKEISEITLKKANSIKTARYRLRKKLNLSSTENLKIFLSKL